jgi:hypothetical protein
MVTTRRDSSAVDGLLSDLYFHLWRSRLDPYAPGSCLLDVDDRARFDGFSVDDGDLALDAAGQQDASWDLPLAAAAERPFQGQQGSTLIALLPTCCRQTYFLLDQKLKL